MGKHILTALLGGLLVVGVATAFAEELQVSEQDVVKAQMKAQIEVQQLAEAAIPELKGGPQLLTDEDLDQVSAAGFRNIALITNRASGFMFVGPCGILVHCSTGRTIIAF